MGTISSGVGLISGLNIQQLVDQLIAVESRPRDRLLQRIGLIDAERAAFADLSARIGGILSRVSALKTPSTFQSFSANSSQPGVLSATASLGAVPGAFSFVVKSLASTHQVVSRGFASLDESLPQGSITLESAAARVNSSAKLDELNGFAGVSRGVIKLTDGSGESAEVDLTDAITLGDVVERLNGSDLNISAAVTGDGLTLTENSGKSIKIEEVKGGTTAADLGFGIGNNSSASGEVVGSSLVRLTNDTPLSALNDGLGVRVAKAGADFTIDGLAIDLSEILTDATRVERLNHGAPLNLGKIRLTTLDAADKEVKTEIDLTGLKTVGGIRKAIEDGTDGLTVTLVSNRMVISYADGAKDRKLSIEDVSGSGAKSLGLAGSSETGKLDGKGLLKVDRVVDVLNAINFASGNNGSVKASFDGVRFKIDAGSETPLLENVGDSKTLRDLGFAAGGYAAGAITGGRVLASLDSTLLKTLNGGAGYALGAIRIGVGAGSLDVDLKTAESLSDVVSLINKAAKQQGLSLEAGIDANGTGLELRTQTAGALISVVDLSGDFAAKSGLTGKSGISVASDNLQRRYVSENTTLASLNQGRGVGGGEFTITNSKGATATISVLGTSSETLRDIISQINGAGIGVAARINDTGDGLLIEDTAGGGGALKIESKNGTAAADLNLTGEVKNNRVDGSYELRVELSGSQTLQDVANKINGFGGLATASILNDGSGATPFRLNVTSRASGARGELILSGVGINLQPTTLTAGADAKVLLGGGVLVTSATNQLKGVVPGVTLDLLDTSEDPVTVTIAQDDAKLIEALNGLVSAFNAAVERLDEFTDYDQETEQKGLLLGDASARLTEERLYRLLNRSLPESFGSVTRLSQLGIRLSEGKLTFDQQQFEETLAGSREDVVRFFTDEKGLGEILNKELEAISGSEGLLKGRDGTLETQREQFSERVTRLNALLDRKRERLTRQFLAMEQALAQLQSQQGALGQLSALAAAAGSQNR